MKSNVVLIAALFVFGAVVNAVGKEDPNVRAAIVPVKGTEVFKVIYKSETAVKVRINIYNSSSQIVFSETLSNTEGFIRPLNFSGLKAGEYTIELVEGSTRKSEKVSYTPSSAVASNKVVRVSKLNENDGRFLVSIGNAKSESITVRILDKTNQVIYTETREIGGDFAQVYRVKDSDGVKFEIYDASGLAKSSRF